MKPNILFEHLIAKKNLNSAQMEDIIHACMSGQLSDAQIATFLALMRMKGETIEELTAAAKVMQQLSKPIHLGSKLIDIVGTGGDGKNTFNVSTACSFVVAASGFPVAKHGNRSVSSQSGSADLLEQAGFVLTSSEKDLQTCIQQCNLAFLFAPHFHPAMHHARQARQQLGIRTLFNILGPLVNPARAQKQVVGIFSTTWLEPLATVLANMGSERTLVVSSQDGLDEISIAAPTEVMEFHDGQFQHWIIHPEEYGLMHTSLDEVIVRSPAESLTLIESVLAGNPSPARDMVILNSAAAIYCANEEISLLHAVEIARSAIDSGKALQCYNQLRSLTQSLYRISNHD